MRLEPTVFCFSDPRKLVCQKTSHCKSRAFSSEKSCLLTSKNFTNGKLSYNCHQFRLIELSGNYKCSSTVRLTKQRWDVTNQRLVESGAQVLGQRDDLVCNLSKLVETGELAPNVAQSFLKNFHDNARSVDTTR